jgi:hypothetical protein
VLAFWPLAGLGVETAELGIHVDEAGKQVFR